MSAGPRPPKLKHCKVDHLHPTASDLHWIMHLPQIWPLEYHRSSGVMGVGLLVSVDPQKLQSANPTGLDLRQVSYFGSCLVRATPETAEENLTFLQQNFSRLAIYVDVRKLKAWDEVVGFLNAGAAKVFVTFEQLKHLSQEPTILPDRLVLTISPVNPKTDITKLKEFLSEHPAWRTTEWAFDGDKGKDFVDSVLTELDNYPPSVDQTIYINVTSEADGQGLLHKYPGDALIIPSERLTLDPKDEANEKLIPAPKLVLAGATADRKTGLFATVVTDEHGVALGFVWSSEESIAEALKTGTGVYQSRKRGLWYKGAISGEIQ